jgi:hypothetical protein
LLPICLVLSGAVFSFVGFQAVLIRHPGSGQKPTACIDQGLGLKGKTIPGVERSDPHTRVASKEVGRPTVNEEELLESLQALTDRLGIPLLRREGDFVGGIYRLKDQRVFLINSSLSTAETINIFCRELAGIDLSRVFILPALREMIETTRRQAARNHRKQKS